MPRKWTIPSIFRIHIILTISGLFVFGFGIILISRSEKGVAHEMGVLFVTIIPVLFCYELFLRNHLIEQMQKKLKETIISTGIEKKVLETFIKTLPNSYQNIFELGVSDAFPELKAEDLIKKISESENTIIKMIEIWIPFLDAEIDYETVVSSIVERGCKYRILLSDPEKEDPLIRRTRSCKRGYDLERYKYHISENILFFRSVWQELKKQNFTDIDKALQVRLHNNFISVALLGFLDHYYFGLYLDGRLANKGMQFRIDKDKDKQQGGTKFYRELDDHFSHQWGDAHQSIQFIEDGLGWETISPPIQ